MPAPSRMVRPIAHTDAHALELLPSVAATLDRLFADIERARERVLIETYIVGDDELGRQLGDKLATAAARGVCTRLIYDPLGSHEAKEEIFESMRARGVEVRAYRKPSVDGKRWSLFPRDHGRLLVVDGAAYMGGLAFARPWLPLDRGGGGWHDVCVRVEGPCADGCAELFDLRWAEARGEPPATERRVCADPLVEVVAEAPRYAQSVFELHIEAFQAARRRIWIENSYFYPPEAMIGALYSAARRGVDVRVIVPGRSDLPIVKRAARSRYDRWLGCGLSLFEYQPAVLHSKFALVDEDWGTVGSFNCNATSCDVANELNLIVKAPAFVDLLAEQFERDLAVSAPVVPGGARELGAAVRALDWVSARAFEVGMRLVNRGAQASR